MDGHGRFRGGLLLHGSVNIPGGFHDLITASHCGSSGTSTPISLYSGNSHGEFSFRDVLYRCTAISDAKPRDFYVRIHQATGELSLVEDE